jgi:transcription termination factor Rho
VLFRSRTRTARTAATDNGNREAAQAADAGEGPSTTGEPTPTTGEAGSTGGQAAEAGEAREGAEAKAAEPASTGDGPVVTAGERPAAATSANGETVESADPPRSAATQEEAVSADPEPQTAAEPARDEGDASTDAPGQSTDGSVAVESNNGAASAGDAVQDDQSSPAPPPGDRGRSEGRQDGRQDGRVDDRQRENRDQRDQRGPRDGGRPGFDNTGDAGNRRSRRRRGRDRGEREPQQDRGQDQQYSGELVPAEGLLDLRDEGYGFLRTSGYLAGPRDAYVSLSQVRRFALRKGDYVQGASRPAGSNEKYPALLRIDTVNGMTPDEARGRPRFEDLTPLFPDQRLRLEVPGETNNMIARIVDLVSPIGKGQRGLIVSPPKAGKTTVLKQVAHSIEANNPEVKLMVLLVDERPEEVTDFRRSVKGEVIASTFDRPSDEHAQVAELTLERAKRLVELGQDVVIVLDGITRLSRAYNLAGPATGRIMSGGLDVNALYPPKRFFGAARNIEEGGSLTILATALVETGGKMDEVIFEEFKGTGNMELKLDRKLAERRIYPALDVNASSTRHEELLFDRGQLPQVWKLRRVLNALEPGAGLELLMDKIKSTKSNDEFLAEIAKAPVPAI